MSDRRLAKTAPLLFTLAGLSLQADAQSCSAGRYWDGHNCQPCGVGTYNPFPTNPAVTACQPAQPGYFVPNLGSTAAQACPVGQTSAAGASACAAIAAAPVPVFPGLWAGLLAALVGVYGWFGRRRQR